MGYRIEQYNDTIIAIPGLTIVYRTFKYVKY